MILRGGKLHWWSDIIAVCMAKESNVSVGDANNVVNFTAP